MATRVLVSGAAGFIGFHLAARLARDGFEVLGFDNLNDYYDTDLKYGRLADLGLNVDPGIGNDIVTSTIFSSLRFVRLDLADDTGLKQLIGRERPDVVINLAAQAGVRYSLENPHSYETSNVRGFLNLLEALRAYPVSHLIYASSSSVYGADSPAPFREDAAADRPVSLYAATKRANELMAHSYAHLYGIPATGLRFFTVYGPWGRPDMAYFLFTRAILSGEPIRVFNHGDMQRDFTYVDDIVESIVRLMPQPPSPDAVGGSSRVFNIGNGAPVRLMDFIDRIERELGMTAEKEYLPMQPGDVPVTWADCSALTAVTGYAPETSVQDGMHAFVRWYRSFYGIQSEVDSGGTARH